LKLVRTLSPLADSHTYPSMILLNQLTPVAIYKKADGRFPTFKS